MANRTQQEINQNEVRPIELTMHNDTGAPFYPTSATVSIYNSSGTALVTDAVAMVAGEKITYLLGTTITANVGSYVIKWKIIYGSYTYYHATDIDVVEL
jgi:hypothetical protein